MRYNTTLGDDNTTKELVQLFIVADSELQVARDDTEIRDASMILVQKPRAALRTVVSCYHGRHCPQVRGSQRQGIREPRRGRRVHRHRHVEHSCHA